MSFLTDKLIIERQKRLNPSVCEAISDFSSARFLAEGRMLRLKLVVVRVGLWWVEHKEIQPNELGGCKSP